MNNISYLRSLVDEFCTARFGRLQSLEEMIVEAGAAAVPFLLSAYHSTRIDKFCCFEIILKMKPDAYMPILATAINKDEDGLAMLAAIEHYREPLPDAVSLLVAGLESSDSDILRGCLKAIAAQYPIIEIACPDQARPLMDCTQRLLNLLNHETHSIQHFATECLATLAPKDPEVVHRLIQALKRQLNDFDINVPSRLIRAIAAFGPFAAETIPTMMEVLRGDSHSAIKSGAFNVLAATGGKAEPSLPELQAWAATEPHSWIKKDINRTIKAIRGAIKTAGDKAKMDPRLFDLLEMMRNYDRSSNGNMLREHEVLKRVADPTLLPAMSDRFRSKLTHREYYHLCRLLGAVTRNTDSDEGRRLIASLLSNENLHKEDVDSLLRAAKECCAREAFPLVVARFKQSDNAHFTTCLDYFEALKDDASVEVIGSEIRERPHNCLLSVFALEEIGSPKAWPYLIELVERDLTSKKAEESEWRFYSIHALGKLKATEAIPRLLSLLMQPGFERYRSSILSTLSEMDVESVYPVIVTALQRVIEEETFTKVWQPHSFRTTLVNGFNYLRRMGMLPEPAVLDMLGQLKSTRYWGKLVDEERMFLAGLVPFNDSDGAWPGLRLLSISAKPFALRFSGEMKLSDGSRGFGVTDEKNGITYIQRIGSEWNGFRVTAFEQTGDDPDNSILVENLLDNARSEVRPSKTNLLNNWRDCLRALRSLIESDSASSVLVYQRGSKTIRLICGQVVEHVEYTARITSVATGMTFSVRESETFCVETKQFTLAEIDPKTMRVRVTSSDAPEGIWLEEEKNDIAHSS